MGSRMSIVRRFSVSKNSVLMATSEGSSSCGVDDRYESKYVGDWVVAMITWLASTPCEASVVVGK